MGPEFRVNELLVRAWDSFESCRFHVLRLIDRTQYRAAATQKRHDGQAGVLNIGTRAEEWQVPEDEHRLSFLSQSRIWLRKPDRWREERLSEDGRTLATEIASGDVRIEAVPGEPTVTSRRRRPTTERLHGAMVGFDYLDLLDPAWLAGPTLEVVSEGEHGRQPAICVATPADGSRCPMRYRGSDELRLWVHGLHGILVGVSAFRRGAEWMREDLTSVGFDERLPDDLFHRS